MPNDQMTAAKHAISIARVLSEQLSIAVFGRQIGWIELTIPEQKQ
jgi:hypothetical protein